MVKKPFLLQVDVAGMHAMQLGRNVVDNGTRVIAVRRDTAFGEVVEVIRLEDVERVKLAIHQIDNGRQDAN